MKKTAREQNEGQGFDPRVLQMLLPAAAMFTELRELVVHVGLRALEALLEQERTAICGPRYAHDPARAATRNGHAPGALVLGGRRVTVKRPRAQAVDGGEVALPSWQQFAATDPLTARAVEQMVVGVSTRKYARSLDAVPEGVEACGDSKSAVSRRFVAATREQLATWMTAPLGAVDLVAVMIDGLCVGEHVVLCALGIDARGTKHALGLCEGATENAAACLSLLRNLRERGLRTDRATLFVLDGSAALAKAVREVFGRRALIQRCQVHKVRNVLDHLPKGMHAGARKALNDAYRAPTVATAKRRLNTLLAQLTRKHPGAAASLREGLDETLTVLGLGLTGLLARSLATTNAIENMNGVTRGVKRRVKRWRDGEMILRWVGAAVHEAARGFRRLKGHADIKQLERALRAHDRALDAKKTHDVVDTTVEAA
jgi:transposase-like protein